MNLNFRLKILREKQISQIVQNKIRIATQPVHSSLNTEAI